MDLINGAPGHELKFEEIKITSGFLRVGYTSDGNTGRTYETRCDFIPSVKVQMEDDISCSVTVPQSWLPLNESGRKENVPLNQGKDEVPLLLQPQKEVNSHKLICNCELRLFQRLDDCIHHDEDTQTEHDLSQPGNFIANFEPLHPKAIHKIVQMSVILNYLVTQ
jgi:hypothetical protein